MVFLRTRTYRSLADTYSSADIARLTGLSRGRIAQLRSCAEPDALPEPDAEQSTKTRPLWRGDTVARWCARTGRRLPPRTAPWLLPGPDGPHLRRDSHTTLHLHQDGLNAVDARIRHDLERPAIDVHVARYTPPASEGPSVWLAAVLAPGQWRSLMGWPPLWPHGDPLNHLIQEIARDAEPHPEAHSDLLGTLVLLPTLAEPEYTLFPPEVRLLDLYSSDLAGEQQEDLHHRMRRLRADDEELHDLVTALGHRLPWWPPGCATPLLAASWTPGAPRHQDVPPPLAEAQAFVRRCESAADDLTGSLRASVLELGISRWDSSLSGWRPGEDPSHGQLPKGCPPDVWQLAVEFSLPPAPAMTGDFWEGLEWLMEHAPSPRLAQDALAYFGDPGSAGVAAVDTALLPHPVKNALTAHITAATATGSHRAQRVLDALDDHPDAAAGTQLGHWPAPTGPVWCATSHDDRLIALHVPRRMPAPDESTGKPLEIVLLRTASATHHPPAPAVGFVVTDRDQLMLLPALGKPEALAAAIEHTVWHPGIATLVVGLMPSSNEPLVAAVEALLQTGPRTTGFDQLTALVGPHPQRGYCSYCRKLGSDASRAQSSADHI
ncbi:hypothetical protein AB0G73_23920 [Streptomyces sp. NPDC020719]|uniref:hypothetical protein n=1 Tax=Streptomyces sp. NPDC020719 TaxID=3154896 RepID=UPI0033F5B0AE